MRGHHWPLLKVQCIMLGCCIPGHGLRDCAGLNPGMENPWGEGHSGLHRARGYRGHKRSRARVQHSHAGS